MTHAYLYLCFYIAMQLKKLNNISRRSHSISLSTQPGFCSCSFSFSPLDDHFFTVAFLYILKKIYYLLAEEKMTSEAKWKYTYPCLKRRFSNGQNATLDWNPDSQFISWLRIAVCATDFFKFIFLALYLHWSDFTVLLKIKIILFSWERNPMKLWNQAMNFAMAEITKHASPTVNFLCDTLFG